jgi:Flp pilus assembly protein TadD
VLQEAQQHYREQATRGTQLALASALFDVGRFEDAERLQRDILEKQGEDIQLCYDLAFTYKNMKRVEDAKRMFLRVVALDGRHAFARSAENEVWMLDSTYTPSWIKREPR